MMFIIIVKHILPSEIKTKVDFTLSLWTDENGRESNENEKDGQR